MLVAWLLLSVDMGGRWVERGDEGQSKEGLVSESYYQNADFLGRFPARNFDWILRRE